GAEEPRAIQPHSQCGIHKWVVERVRQRDRNAPHAEFVCGEELELVTLGYGDRLDLDELRACGNGNEPAESSTRWFLASPRRGCPRLGRPSWASISAQW